MTRPWTVQVGYAAYWAHTVTVEAETLDEALEKAIETANQSEGWRSTDHCGDSFVDAACEGADADPWNSETSLPVPDRFTEQGEPPVVTLTDPAEPRGGIEVSGGRVLLRFTTGAGTVTTEMRDPPHSAGQQAARHRLSRAGRQAPRQGRGRERKSPDSGRLTRPPAHRRSIAGPGSAPPGAGAGSPPGEGGPGRGSVPGLPRPVFVPPEIPPMKPHPPSIAEPAGPAAGPPDPGDEAQKRAIAQAVWTEIHWLMPRDRTVTVTVEGDDIAVELGPPARSTSH